MEYCNSRLIYDGIFDSIMNKNSTKCFAMCYIVGIIKISCL